MVLTYETMQAIYFMFSRILKKLQTAGTDILFNNAGMALLTKKHNHIYFIIQYVLILFYFDTYILLDTVLFKKLLGYIYF